MNVIAKNRGMGKTTELIRRSSETGYPIVTIQQGINHIKFLAKQMDVDIPEPIKITDLINLRGSNINYIIIDQLDLLINCMLPNNLKVDVCSIDLEKIIIDNDKDNKRLTKQDLLNLLYDDYAIKIQKEDYGTALNIMKNIDMLSNQIRQDKE